MIQSAAEQCLQCTSKRGAWVSPGFSSHPLLPCSHNDRVRKQITHAHKPHWDNYFVCRDPQGNSSRSWLIWIDFPAPLLLWSCTTYRNHSNAPEVYHRPSVDKHFPVYGRVMFACHCLPILLLLSLIQDTSHTLTSTWTATEESTRRFTSTQTYSWGFVLVMFTCKANT